MPTPRPAPRAAPPTGPDVHRRELLRVLVVTGLAGCTTSPGDALVTAATPTPAPAPPVRASDPARTAAPDAPDAPARTEPAATAPADEPADEPDDETPRVVSAVGRSTLGLPPARPGGRRHAITGLMVHHTAGPAPGAGGAADRFRGITRAHREEGWVDVAYHWGVDADGTIYELRDESVAGDTHTGYDPAGWFLVVCDGNFETASPPPAMLESLADVLAHGATRYGIDPATLRGHRDLAATACPGANLHTRLAALADAVGERMAAGGVVLRAG